MQGVSVQGGLCQGALCLGVSAKGLSVWGSLSRLVSVRKTTQYGNVWVECILLQFSSGSQDFDD